MSEINDSEEFVELMTSFQGRLYAYIVSLTADPEAANDILQETNLVLWQKSGEYAMGTNFKAWSFRVANFRVMAHRQRKMRDRLVFDDEMIKTLTADAGRVDDNYEVKMNHVNSCIEKLTDRQQDLIEKRYKIGFTVKKIAADLGSTANSITQALFRARTNLVNCVKTVQEDI